MIKINPDQVEGACTAARDFAQMQREFWNRAATTWKWTFVAASTLGYFVIKEISGLTDYPLKITLLVLVSLPLIWIIFYLYSSLRYADSLQYKCDELAIKYFGYKHVLLDKKVIPMEAIRVAKKEAIQFLEQEISTKKNKRRERKVVTELEDLKIEIEQLDLTENNEIDFPHFNYLFQYQLLIPQSEMTSRLHEWNIRRISHVIFLNRRNSIFNAAIRLILLGYLAIYIIAVLQESGT